MACKGIKHARQMANVMAAEAVIAKPKTETVQEVAPVERLIFGVDSKIEASDILQNNISMFEWVVRNKIYPTYWGRNIVGKNALTREEIEFIHSNNCRIALIYTNSGSKETYESGRAAAKEVDLIAFELLIPVGTAVFLEIPEGEVVSRDYMKGFAEGLIEAGFTPAFKANTDAMYDFDRAFSQGLQTDREIFEQCLVWAVAPSLPEYDRVTTTHLIHPDNWKPYAPSGITRDDIAIWQYGRNCHPINDDAGVETTFNVNLVKNKKLINEKMF